MNSGGSDILHLVRDEKFIDHVIDMFEAAAPGASRYVVYNRRSPDEIKLIKQRDRVDCVPCGTPAFAELQNSVGNYRGVLIHCAEKELAEFMQYCHGRTKLVWLSWGVDIYAMAGTRQHGWTTWKLLLTQESEGVGGKLKFLLRPLYHFLQLNPWAPRDPLLRGALGSDYCIPVIREDYELFQRRFGRKFPAKLLEFNYSCIEGLLGPLADRTAPVNGNILLGNSASSSCNHAEAIDLLRKFDLGGRKVITPLSYGSTRYRDLIRDYGQARLGRNFMPLIDFMPLPQYTETISSCSAVVMNHYRQQAVGNIIPMLWMGARLYLSERNPLYDCLQRWGLPVFRIEHDLRPDRLDTFAPLPDADRERARAILRREYGRDTVVARTANVVRTLRGEA